MTNLSFNKYILGYKMEVMEVVVRAGVLGSRSSGSNLVGVLCFVSCALLVNSGL